MLSIGDVGSTWEKDNFCNVESLWKRPQIKVRSSAALSCVAGVSKGRGKWVLGAREKRSVKAPFPSLSKTCYTGLYNPIGRILPPAAKTREVNSQLCADRVLTTRRDIFTSCSCLVYFKVNRKPVQSDKYSGHIFLFLGVKIGAILAPPTPTPHDFSLPCVEDLSVQYGWTRFFLPSCLPHKNQYFRWSEN